MPLLPSRHYVSDHTRFIRDLLEKKPQLETDQRIGRAIFWDKLPSDVAGATRHGRRGASRRSRTSTRTTIRKSPHDPAP